MYFCLTGLSEVSTPHGLKCRTVSGCTDPPGPEAAPASQHPRDWRGKVSDATDASRSKRSSWPGKADGGRETDNGRGGAGGEITRSARRRDTAPSPCPLLPGADLPNDSQPQACTRVPRAGPRASRAGRCLAPTPRAPPGPGLPAQPCAPAPPRPSDAVGDAAGRGCAFPSAGARPARPAAGSPLSPECALRAPARRHQ